MKISLCLVVFIITLFFIFSVSASNYIIDGDTVYINDSNVYLSAYPHTLEESGYSYFNLTSKKYTGDIDICWGFNTSECRPLHADILINDHWVDVSDRFNSVNYNYDNKNKWYYLKEIPVIANTNYTLRAYLKINPIAKDGKYGVALKPSFESIHQAITNGHFYYMDPWWNGSWTYRKTITLTGGASGAQTNYQLLLNITYDTDMQPDFDDLRFVNDTHQIDAWLETNTPDYALVWVEFPTTPANGIDQDYYMYYGKADAEDDWNGTDTFIQHHGNTTTHYHDANIITPTAVVYEARVKSTDDTHYLRWGMQSTLWTDYIAIQIYSPSDQRWVIARTAGSESAPTENPTFTTDVWYRLRIDIISSSNVHGYVNDNEIGGGITTNIPIMNLGLSMDVQEGTFVQEWAFVHKYAANPPTCTFGEEKKITNPPTNLDYNYSKKFFYVNWTWEEDLSWAGSAIDSYNVSINGTWHNDTANQYYNHTGLNNGLISSIVVYGYNDTIGLSSGYVSGEYIFNGVYKTVFAIQKLVEPLTSTKDKFFNIIPFIMSIILFAGFGLAIIVITSKIKRW